MKENDLYLFILIKFFLKKTSYFNFFSLNLKEEGKIDKEIYICLLEVGYIMKLFN